MAPAEVVRGAQDALARLRACDIVLDIELGTDLLRDSITVQVWEDGEGRQRVIVLAATSPQLCELAFVTDGQESLLYSPHTGQALIGPADVVQMPSVIEETVRAWRAWMENAVPRDARLVARERESGLVVYKIEVPLSQNGYARYWVDASSWLVRQVTYRDEHLGTGTIRVRQVDCTSRDVRATLGVRSVLTIPDGVPIKEVSVKENRPLTLEEAQRAVSFPLCVPLDLPGDTYFSVAYQLDKNMALVYAGERPFTLVQGPRIGRVPTDKATPVSLRGLQGRVVRDEESKGIIVLTWREDDLQFSIAGSLSVEEATRVAESLEYAFRSDEAMVP